MSADPRFLSQLFLVSVPIWQKFWFENIDFEAAAQFQPRPGQSNHFDAPPPSPGT